MWIDTLAHVFDTAFSEDYEQVLLRARQQNVNQIVLVGYSHRTNEKAYEMAKRYPFVYPTAGLHPSEANENVNTSLEQLDLFLKHHRVVAIGECGLDYHYGKDNLEAQKELFEGQIALAIRYRLPLVIHMRDATQDTYTLLKKYEGKIWGVMHCYSGSYEMALEFIKLGFYISLGGPVTFKNAKETKRIAEKLDLNRLLIETDCPYLAPQPYRGKRNEPSYVVEVGKHSAAMRTCPEEDVANRTTANARTLFQLEERK